MLSASVYCSATSSKKMFKLIYSEGILIISHLHQSSVPTDGIMASQEIDRYSDIPALTKNNKNYSKNNNINKFR